MRYAVTVEARAIPGKSQAPPPRLSSVVIADDKDDAFTRAVSSYRIEYPEAGDVTVHVIRLRP